VRSASAWHTTTLPGSSQPPASAGMQAAALALAAMPATTGAKNPCAWPSKGMHPIHLSTQRTSCPASPSALGSSPLAPAAAAGSAPAAAAGSAPMAAASGGISLCSCLKRCKAAMKRPGSSALRAWFQGLSASTASLLLGTTQSAWATKRRP
jgi:hypothetical protein